MALALRVVSTPFYPQLEERDCGATCLRMILAQHGRAVTMTELRELSGTTQSGADLAGLARAAEALGFEAIAAELDYDDLLGSDLWPALLHWDGDHFVVLTEADDARAVVLDPAFGERRLDRAAFEAHRIGAGRSRAGLVVLPKDRTGEPEALSATHVPEATAEESHGAVDDTDEGDIAAAPPRSLIASVALYAGLLSGGLYVIARALQLAVDLQYREGWLREVGALLAVSAAVLIGRYLVRRAALRYAAERGEEFTSALEAALAASNSPTSRLSSPEAVLSLVADADAVKVFGAYRIGELCLAGVGVVLAVAFAMSADALVGAALAIALLLVGLLYHYYDDVGADTQAQAVEAQANQREAIYERVDIQTELGRLGLDGRPVIDRLQQRNVAASAAFTRVATEMLARGELITATQVLSALTVVSLGLYRLGYAGLQVGPLLFLAVLLWLGLSRLSVFAKAYAAYRQTAPARARLAELAEGRARRTVRASTAWPPELHLVWRSAGDQVQRLSFPSRTSLGLVGGDEGTRAALVAACLGRENVLGAVLSEDPEGARAAAVSDYGRVALIGPDVALVSGTVASNVTLAARTDLGRLRVAARGAGLLEEQLSEGFSTRIAFAGRGVGDELRARILVARALYHGADVIVVDGGTDGLSSYDEAYLIDMLTSVPGVRLLLCNARRPLATVGLDYLAQLEETELEAFGTHEDLLADGGAYAIQYASQNVLRA